MNSIEESGNAIFVAELVEVIEAPETEKGTAHVFDSLLCFPLSTYHGLTSEI